MFTRSTLVWITIAAGVCGFSAAQAETCTLQKIANFNFSKSPSNLVTIPISVNEATEQFVVSTASSLSLLSSDTADRQHLATYRSGIKFFRFDGSVLDRYVDIDELRVGTFVKPHVKMLVLHTNKGAAGGLLGLDLLRHFDIEFDSAHKTLNLFSPNHCLGSVVYWSTSYTAIPISTSGSDYAIKVPVTLDGHDFAAQVDTGSSYSALSAKIAYQVFNLDTESPGMERIPPASQHPPAQYRYRFKSLSLQGITVRNPLIAILPDTAEAAIKRNSNEQKADNDPIYGLNLSVPRVILGMDILSQLHFYIAYGEKTLYVTAADAGRAPQALAAPSTAAK